MSEWATLEPFGEPHTSFSFRDDYLRDGVELGPFYCPFCNIGLFAVLIYKDGKCGKSPYFSSYKCQFSN